MSKTIVRFLFLGSFLIFPSLAMDEDGNPLTPTTVITRVPIPVDHGPFPVLDLNIGSPPRPIVSPPPSATDSLRTRFQVDGLANPLPPSTTTSSVHSSGYASEEEDFSEDSKISSPTSNLSKKAENRKLITDLDEQINSINVFINHAQQCIDRLDKYIERRFSPSSSRTVSLPDLLAENNIIIDDESAEDSHSTTSSEASSDLDCDEEYITFLQSHVADLSDYAKYLLGYAQETTTYGKMLESELGSEADSPLAEEEDPLARLAEEFESRFIHQQWRKKLKGKNLLSAEKNHVASNGRYVSGLNSVTGPDFHHRRWNEPE